MERLSSVQSILEQVRLKAESERQVEAESQANKAKRKRIIFVRRMVALSFLMVGLFTMFSFAEDFTYDVFDEDNRIKAIEKEIAQYDQVEVFVQKGDSAWTIQKKLTPGKDMRDMLFYVEYINDRNSIGEIKAGEVLIFLKAKDSK